MSKLSKMKVDVEIKVKRNDVWCTFKSNVYMILSWFIHMHGILTDAFPIFQNLLEFKNFYKNISWNPKLIELTTEIID